MTREHLSPARGRVRADLIAVAVIAALAISTSACSSSGSTKGPAAGSGQTTAVAAADPSTAANAAAGSSTPAPAGGGGNSTSAAAPAAGGGKVGQPVKAGPFTVTVHKVSYPYSNSYDSPDSGKAYVLVDVEVANNSNTSQSVSSLLQFGVKDAAGTNYDETIVMGVDGEAPDGDIAPGKSLHGPAAFEVPAGSKGLSFTFKSDLDADRVLIPLGK